MLLQAEGGAEPRVETAKAAIEKADADNKAELTKKIEEANAALTAAIDALSARLDLVESELSDKDAALEKTAGDLKTFIIIVCVMSSVALAGSGAFTVWFFIDRKKRA